MDYLFFQVLLLLSWKKLTVSLIEKDIFSPLHFLSVTYRWFLNCWVLNSCLISVSDAEGSGEEEGYSLILEKNFETIDFVKR